MDNEANNNARPGFTGSSNRVDANSANAAHANANAASRNFAAMNHAQPRSQGAANPDSKVRFYDGSQPTHNPRHADSKTIRLPQSNSNNSTSNNPRVIGANPRVTGSSPRVTGANPRVTGSNPRVTGAHRSVSNPNVKPMDAHSPKVGQNGAVKPAAPAKGNATGTHASTLTKKANFKIPLVVACACIVIAGAFFAVTSLLPINVQVNGNQVSVGGAHTIKEAVDSAGVYTTPGDLVAVDGSVLEQGGGTLFSATVNGTPISDETYKLSSGDELIISDGMDKEEPSSAIDAPAPFGVEINGTGTVRKVSGPGQEGKQQTKTGEISGKTVDVVVEQPVNVICERINPDTQGRKIIALTFDDGPHTAYTTQVLDILRDNGAKATFFTIGRQITGDNSAVVKRASEEGHQICTHSFDHAAGSGQGVNLGYMTPEEIVNEITQGYEAIEAATGAEASHVIRTPGGNFGENVITTLSPYITAEINWSIDTEDWRRPGAEAIKNQILRATPGSIVLMHDGGGDRSQTVQAIAEAIPILVSQGYEFVTIDEMIPYAQ